MFVVVLLLAVAHVRSFTVVTKTKRCSRSVTVTRFPLLNPRLYNFRSFAVCRAFANSTASVSHLNFRVQSPTNNKLPGFTLRGFSKPSTDVENSDNKAASFFSMFGITRIVEFEDANGEAGFQPDTTDKIVSEVKLETLSFSSISRSTEEIGNATVNTLQFSASSNKIFEKITFAITVTSEEVVAGTNFNGKKKTIISPNTMKLDITLEKLSYNSTNSRIAIGSVLVTRSTVAKRTNSETVSDEGVRPDEPSDDQEVLSISDENSSGTFSFKRFITNGKASNATARALSLSSSKVVASGDGEFEGGSVNIGSKKTITQLWFSIEGQSSTAFWDPALGQSETAESPSSSSTLFSSKSITVVLSVASIVCFIIMNLV